MAVLNNRGIGSLSGKPATHPIYPRGPTTDVYVIPNSHGPTGPGRVAGNLGNSGTTLMLHTQPQTSAQSLTSWESMDHLGVHL